MEPLRAAPQLFLKLAGAAAWRWRLPTGNAQAAGQGTARSSDRAAIGLVQIAANGEVTVTINRLEFGQGVQTALPMILRRTRRRLEPGAQPAWLKRRRLH